MTTKEQTLDKNGFDFEAFKYENEYSAKNLLIAMDEHAKEKAIEFLDWVKNYEGEQKIILCDNDFYWEADDEGDNPMGGKELMEIFQNTKNK